MADVVAGLALQDDCVLLGKRKARGKRGSLWEMPGGKVEGSEDHFVALRREWREELGVDIHIGDRIAGAMLDLEVCFTVHLYAVVVVGTPTALDHDELSWVKLEHAIEYLPCSPALYLHYPAVRQYLKTRR